MWYWESAPPQCGQEVSSVKSGFFFRLEPCICLSQRIRTQVAGHDSGTSAQVVHRCSPFVRYHLPYGRSRRPLLVASALVSGDSYCLYHVLYVVQAGSCRERQGADRKPGGQKRVLKEMVASNDRRIKQGAVLEYSCSVFLASDPIRKVYPKVFILKALFSPGGTLSR